MDAPRAQAQKRKSHPRCPWGGFLFEGLDDLRGGSPPHHLDALAARHDGNQTFETIDHLDGLAPGEVSDSLLMEAGHGRFSYQRSMMQVGRPVNGK
jgi:hypothetical protein